MGTQTAGLAHAAYHARRVVQTCSTFANWRTLLHDMVEEKLGRGSGRPLEFVTRGGARLSCPNVPGARLPMFEQFADDCYDLRWCLGAAVGHPLQVLDVGSHVGAFASNLALARPDVRVECYEPSPDTARYLQQNVERNGLSERVRVHQCAIAGTDGTALLDDNSGGSVHNGLVKSDHRLVAGTDALATRATIEVTTTTFDRAVADAPAPFDLVKMDCEGGEYELVYASSPTSWASVQRVVMEYHPVEGESWAELRDWLERVGLHLVRHEPGRPGLGTAWLSRSIDQAPRSK